MQTTTTTDRAREISDARLIDSPATLPRTRSLTGYTQDSIDDVAAIEKLLSGMSDRSRKQFCDLVLKRLDAWAIEELNDALVAMRGGRS